MKAILHYLALVGLPILGILGLLQLGSSLQAPASIGGIWLLQPADAEVQNADCAKLFTETAVPTLLISQSGIFLQLTMNTTEKLTLTGRLTGLEVVAEADTAVFQATINRESEPDSLTGKLLIPPCTLSLTGLRQPELQTAIGGH
jgi:hypothetical protein